MPFQHRHWRLLPQQVPRRHRHHNQRNLVSLSQDRRYFLVLDLLTAYYPHHQPWLVLLHCHRQNPPQRPCQPKNLSRRHHQQM